MLTEASRSRGAVGGMGEADQPGVQWTAGPLSGRTDQVRPGPAKQAAVEPLTVGSQTPFRYSRAAHVHEAAHYARMYSRRVPRERNASASHLRGSNAPYARSANISRASSRLARRIGWPSTRDLGGCRSARSSKTAICTGTSSAMKAYTGWNT